MSQPESLRALRILWLFAIAYMTIILIIASSTMENVQEKAGVLQGDAGLCRPAFRRRRRSRF